MPSSDYYLQINQDGHQVIRQLNSDIAITVMDLPTDQFPKREDQLQFFGHNGSAMYGFQTELADFPFELDLILSAIKWYAEHIGYPDMPITGIDPR